MYSMFCNPSRMVNYISTDTKMSITSINPNTSWPQNFWNLDINVVGLRWNVCRKPWIIRHRDDFCGESTCSWTKKDNRKRRLVVNIRWLRFWLELLDDEYGLINQYWLKPVTQSYQPVNFATSNFHRGWNSWHGLL